MFQLSSIINYKYKKKHKELWKYGEGGWVAMQTDTCELAKILSHKGAKSWVLLSCAEIQVRVSQDPLPEWSSHVSQVSQIVVNLESFQSLAAVKWCSKWIVNINFNYVKSAVCDPPWLMSFDMTYYSKLCVFYPQAFIPEHWRGDRKHTSWI
jgi:hypothetical protein